MKNIHVLPTDKPSRLHEYDYLSPMGLSKEPLQWRLGRNIYITSDEEIKEGDWVYHPDVSQEYTKVNLLKEGDERYTKGQHVAQGVYKHKPTTNEWYKKERKIILTTDKSLEGIQAIDEEFLQWFVKNPSCKEVEIVSISRCCGRCYVYDDLCVADKCCDDHYEYGCEICYGKRINYKIIIQKEEPKQDKIMEKFIANAKKEEEKQIKCYCGHTTYCDCIPLEVKIDILDFNQIVKEPKQESFGEIWSTLTNQQSEYLRDYINRQREDAKKWQQERSYSEEDIIEFAYNYIDERKNQGARAMTPELLIKQFKNK